VADPVATVQAATSIVACANVGGGAVRAVHIPRHGAAYLVDARATIVVGGTLRDGSLRQHEVGYERAC
jgi:hypothetical protein